MISVIYESYWWYHHIWDMYEMKYMTVSDSSSTLQRFFNISRVRWFIAFGWGSNGTSSVRPIQMGVFVKIFILRFLGTSWTIEQHIFEKRLGGKRMVVTACLWCVIWNFNIRHQKNCNEGSCLEFRSWLVSLSVELHINCVILMFWFLFNPWFSKCRLFLQMYHTHSFEVLFMWSNFRYLFDVKPLVHPTENLVSADLCKDSPNKSCKHFQRGSFTCWVCTNRYISLCKTFLDVSDCF